MSQARRRSQAFTLLEVMISLGIFALVSFLLMEMLSRQSRTYTVVDNVAETQQNVRAVAGLLEQEVRSTGFLTPAAGVFCGWDTAKNTADTDPDAIYITNTEALVPPPPPPSPASNDLERAANIVGTPPGVGIGTSKTYTLDSLVLDAPAFYDTDGNGVNDSDFRVPGGVIIFDSTNPARGASCGQITAINVGAKTITVDFTSGGAVPDTALGTPYAALAAVPAHGYWIQVVNGSPRLMRDGRVMAEDVEDLQFAAFYDVGLLPGTGPDGIVNVLGAVAPPPWNDAAEYPGSNAPNSWYVSGERDNTQLRELRVTIVARTRSQDPDVLLNPALANYFQQSPENRTFAAAPPADGFRRRALTMTVAPRNAALK